MLYSRCNAIGFRLLLGLALLLIAWQSLTPAPLPDGGLNDKLLHGLAFLGLAFLVDGSWPRAPFGRSQFLWLAGYGAAIEGLQWLGGARTLSLGDWLADLAGLLLYLLLLGPWLRRRFPPAVESALGSR